MPSDSFLTGSLRELQRLAERHPGTPEAALIRRTRYYLRRGLLDGAPRTRRYLLGDLRAAALKLERIDHD